MADLLAVGLRQTDQLPAVYGTVSIRTLLRDGRKGAGGKLSEDELTQLREEIDAMADTGTLPLKLKLLRKELQAAPAGPAAPQAVPAGSGSKAGSV